MKKISAYIYFLMVCWGAVAFAGEPRWITLDGKDAAIPLVPDASNDRINRVDTPQLVLFPAPKRPSLGTVLLSPGGAYVRLAVVHEGGLVVKMLNDAGWDVAELLYHVSAGPMTQKLALADAQQALQLLRKRGAEFGLETKQIGGMGFSAGGHLTARLAHETGSISPLDFMVLMYPAYLEKKGKLSEEVIPPNIPIFVYVAADDNYKNSSIALDVYCRSHNLKCEFHLAPSGGHGFGLKSTLPNDVKDWPDKLRAFLKTVVTRRQ